MNKLYQSLLLLVLIQVVGITQSIAQNHGISWVKQSIGKGGSNIENFNSIKHDAEGNFFITGVFQNYIVFGNTSFFNNGANDSFIAKYDEMGNVLWARKVDSPQGSQGEDLAVDGMGNVYMLGNFSGTASFGSTKITSRGPVDAFIAKYDPSGNLLWTMPVGGNGSDAGLSIAVDNAGNAYITGSFDGTIALGNFAHTSKGSKDIFIAKYDPSGSVVWSAAAGGVNPDYGSNIFLDNYGNVYLSGYISGITSFNGLKVESYGSGFNSRFIAKYGSAYGNQLWVKAEKNFSDITVDGNGNIYVTGSFTIDITFGSTLLTSKGHQDMFIVKYDTSGNMLWAKSGGGEGLDYAYGIDVDVTGNAYLVGEFSGTATFDDKALVSFGEGDASVIKYDQSGNVIWAKSAGGEKPDSGYKVAVDNLGNACVIGQFYSNYFGTFALTSIRHPEAFMAKYNAEGQVLWSKTVTSSSGGSNSGSSITTDHANNIYVTGNFVGTATFGNITLTSNGSQDLFVIKYDSLGNVLWAKSAGGQAEDLSRDIAVDADGNIFVTGTYSYTAAFGNTTLTSAGVCDVFIAKYDTSGNLLWTKSIGGKHEDLGGGIIVDNLGNIIVTGIFKDTVYFGDTSLTSIGEGDAFIAKYDSSGDLLWVKSAATQY